MSGKTRKSLLWWGGVPLVLISLLALVQACTNNEKTFRYRVSFAVEIDGVVKSASSIIQVWYLKLGSQNAAGATGTARYKGVAPVIDLGPDGYLIASMDPYCNYPDKKSGYGKVCKRAVSAAELPKAFGLGYGRKLQPLREGKRNLADDNYPAFIWIARGASWRHTQRICPEEFSSVIGSDVRLVSATIEAATDAPLIHKLELEAPWIDEMRADVAQNKRSLGTAGYCLPGSIFFEW
ncbi:MAG: hypothetical protein KDJ45_05475 [Hyphomicrobiaceae bacterium]|nr:hypothetical protein [Hyphomicrobiaceae bacterium]